MSNPSSVMNPVDIFVGSTLTASSYDSTSLGCGGGRCKVNQVSNDGSGATSEDRTFWQSSPDATCSDQWIQSQFASPVSLLNLTIEYDSLGWSFGAQNSHFQVLLNPGTPQQSDATSITACTSANVTNTGTTNRLDTCTFDKPPTNVGGMRITWGLSKYNGTCQMNVDEIIAFGIPSSATDTPSTGGKSGNSGSPAPPSSNPVDSASNGLSGGAIAGIIVAAIVVLGAAVLYGMRYKNLKRRERAGRL
ncbi:hypothetical protein BC830DRAFT_1113634 [Chytriomyces sp. MP71]|nr:hypothetical protein BC830DRAFT_1113634 [Chytriomyces sp. MP71]